MSTNQAKKPAAFQFRAFSPKQKDLINWWRPDSPYHKYRMMLADGAIRSGKTVAMILSFLLWSTAA